MSESRSSVIEFITGQAIFYGKSSTKAGCFIKEIKTLFPEQPKFIAFFKNTAYALKRAAWK